MCGGRFLDFGGTHTLRVDHADKKMSTLAATPVAALVASSVSTRGRARAVGVPCAVAQQRSTTSVARLSGVPTIDGRKLMTSRPPQTPSFAFSTAGRRRFRRGGNVVDHGICRAAASSDPSSSEFSPFSEPSRLALAAGWVALGGAAAFVAPSGTQAFDLELVTTLVSSPFSGAANPIFEALFNSLGVVPAVYAALLLPGARDQPRLPALPPIVASFALGFFALGPYLILREPREEPVTKSSLGWATRTVFESKPFAIFNAAFAVFLAGYAATHLNSDAVSGFVQLWTEQSALCCVSSCDLLVLSLAMYGAMAEDMRRRDAFDPAKCAAFCALPVVGPTLWLVTRPSLPED